MLRVLLYERVELLNGRDDDAVLMRRALGVLVLELAREDFRVPVAVGRALLKSVVFLHRLIVEVFPVDDEYHLVDVGKMAREQCRLERRERLA